MNDEPAFVFEYEVTSSDIREWDRASRATVYDWLAFTVAVVLAGSGIWQIIQGANAAGMSAILLAGVIFRTNKPSSHIFRLFMWVARPRLRAVITADEVQVETFMRKSKSPSQTLVNSWINLARDGIVEEDRAGFAFVSGAADRFGIPKRVFESDEQMQRFRDFVRSKMGARCQFNSERSSVA